MIYTDDNYTTYHVTLFAYYGGNGTYDEDWIGLTATQSCNYRIIIDNITNYMDISIMPFDKYKKVICHLLKIKKI